MSQHGERNKALLFSPELEMISLMISGVYFQIIFKTNILRIIKGKRITLNKHIILVKCITTSGPHILEEVVNLIRIF